MGDSQTLRLQIPLKKSTKRFPVHCTGCMPVSRKPLLADLYPEVPTFAAYPDVPLERHVWVNGKARVQEADSVWEFLGVQDQGGWRA